MRYAFMIAVLLFSALMIIFDNAAMLGAADGLRLFACSVFPALFPFFVCGRCLILSGIAFRAGKREGGRLSSVLSVAGCAAIAAICGTPTGALLASNMQKEGRITGTSASILCAAYNQMSPLFVFGTLAGALINTPSLGLLFAIAHYAPAILFSIVYALFMPLNAPYTIPEASNVKHTGSPLSVLTNSISEAVLIILRIGGTIVFFRVVCSVILATGALSMLTPIVRNTLFGALEMTNSLQMLTALAPEMRLCCALCSAIMAFGGICVYVQSKLITEIRLIPYFLTKLFIAVISFWLCYALYPLFELTAPVFSDTGISQFGAGDIKERGITIMIALICVTLSITVSSLYAALISRRTKI